MGPERRVERDVEVGEQGLHLGFDEFGDRPDIRSRWRISSTQIRLPTCAA